MYATAPTTVRLAYTFAGLSAPRRIHVSVTEPDPPGNRLLTRMPAKKRQHFLAGCELVNLAYSEILAEPGGPVRYVYFPLDSFISLKKPTDRPGSLEVGLIGHEGMLGISLLLGVGISPLLAVVQGEGTALRMSATRFRRELAKSPELERVLKYYLYVMIDQLAQTAVCCRFHVVEKRLARLLLMTQDRAQSNAFHLTHEFLASMLGVRRVGITKAATALQLRKLICYSRGNIKVLDRPGLEFASCDCYASDNAIYSRTMAPHCGRE